MRGPLGGLKYREKAEDLMDNEHQFFGAVVDAGAILAGFCSTFLVFRIQREANYY
jgi:hypothetical protein